MAAGPTSHGGGASPKGAAVSAGRLTASTHQGVGKGAVTAGAPLTPSPASSRRRILGAAPPSGRAAGMHPASSSLTWLGVTLVSSIRGGGRSPGRGRLSDRGEGIRPPPVPSISARRPSTVSRSPAAAPQARGTVASPSRTCSLGRAPLTGAAPHGQPRGRPPRGVATASATTAATARCTSRATPSQRARREAAASSQAQLATASPRSGASGIGQPASLRSRPRGVASGNPSPSSSPSHPPPRNQSIFTELHQVVKERRERELPPPLLHPAVEQGEERVEQLHSQLRRRPPPEPLE